MRQFQQVCCNKVSVLLWSPIHLQTTAHSFAYCSLTMIIFALWQESFGIYAYDLLVRFCSLSIHSISQDFCISSFNDSCDIFYEVLYSSNAYALIRKKDNSVPLYTCTVSGGISILLIFVVETQKLFSAVRNLWVQLYPHLLFSSHFLWFLSLRLW